MKGRGNGRRKGEWGERREIREERKRQTWERGRYMEI
jgi:hypothetical protein